MFKERHDPINDDEFRQLFDAYKNRLYGYVLAIAHSNYVAEEITQEIFIKLWLCRDILHEVDNLEGYIFTIAHNKTLNHLRKATHNVKLLRELQGLAAPENNNVEERSLVAEYDTLIRDAMNLLSPQRRLVFQLSRYQGLNHEEIALQLKLSRHTVKNHMVEALRFIRHYLGQHGATAIWILLVIIGG